MNAQRTMMTTLALVGLLAPGASASPLTPVYYSTSATIGGAPGTQGPVTFQGFTNNAFVLPGSINLGQFHVGSLPESGTLSYASTPFDITLSMHTQDAQGMTHNAPDVDIKGMLNGSVTGNFNSDMLASVASIEQATPGPLPFPLSALNTGPQLVLPNGINGGSTALTSQVNSTLAAEFLTVPEPTTLAMLATALVGLGFRRRLRVAS